VDYLEPTQNPKLHCAPVCVSRQPDAIDPSPQARRIATGDYENVDGEIIGCREVRSA